jgi:geranylgeranyl diphosphate synthase type II
MKREAPRRDARAAAAPRAEAMSSSDAVRRRQRIEERLAQLVPEADRAPPTLRRALRYSLLAPGKRLRPLLTLSTTAVLGGREALALDPACALELVHTASLVVDDLPCMDDATLRRGRPTSHLAFGENLATLVAFELLNRAFGLLAAAPGLSYRLRVTLLATLSRAVGSEGLIGGQFVDLLIDGCKPDGEQLLEMYGRKTGALFVAAVEIGARVAKAEERWIEPLRNFALSLGIGFQLLDDLQDHCGTRNGTGKDVGQDAGKATLLARLGSDGALREAGRLLDAAARAIEPLGAAGLPLATLGQALVGDLVPTPAARASG